MVQTQSSKGMSLEEELRSLSQGMMDGEDEQVMTPTDERRERISQEIE